MKASIVPCEAASKQPNGRHELAAGEDLDLQSAAAHVVDHLRHLLRGALQHVERGRPRGGHAPLVPLLRDDARHLGERDRPPAPPPPRSS